MGGPGTPGCGDLIPDTSEDVQATSTLGPGNSAQLMDFPSGYNRAPRESAAPRLA